MAQEIPITIKITKEIIMSMTEGEMRDLIESLQSELNFRENERKEHESQRNG